MQFCGAESLMVFIRNGGTCLYERTAQVLGIQGQTGLYEAEAPLREADCKVRVNFVLPGISKTAGGGPKMVFMYSNYLVSKGFDVTICFDCQNMLKRFKVPNIVRHMGSRMLVKVRPNWYKLDKRINKRCIFGISDAAMPEADHVVATWVNSAQPVAGLAPNKGSKHYFIQDYETWDMAPDEVEQTYRLGMSNIVVSDWLYGIVEHASGIKPHKIKNPIDEAVFYPSGEKREEHEVAVLYHPGSHKGFEDAFAALKLAHDRVPDLIVHVFGGPERPDWLPDWCHYTRNASQEQLRSIYSRSSVYLCATIAEGFALTCPEAMYCGCALVSTDFQGVHEYADSNCALLSPVHDPEALADNLVRLLLCPEEARRIAELGSERARRECSMTKALSEVEREFGRPS